MTGKSTLALLLAAAALGGYVLYTEWGADDHEKVVKSSRLLLPGFKAADVRSIRIARPRDRAAGDVVLERDATDAPSGSGGWRMASPVSATADPQEVDRTLSNLEMAEKKQTLPSADPKTVGLDPPRLVVTVERSAAKTAQEQALEKTAPGEGKPLPDPLRPQALLASRETTEIEFGEDDPVSGKQVYVRVKGDGMVYAIASATFGSLDRKANEFRNRAVLKIDRWAVSRISIAGPDGKTAVSFKKDGDNWLMDAPENDTAERARVEELLTSVAELRAKDFVAEPPDAAALAASGLEQPRFVVTLEAGADKQTLEIGKADAEKKELHVRRGGSPTIVTVDDSVARHLVLDVEHWRSQLVLPPSGERVEALEVRQAFHETPLARIVRAGDGEGWTFAAPRTATADAPAVEEMISALRELQVVGTPSKKIEDAANFGLDDMHALVVTLEGATGKRSFRLGKPTARANGYFIQREGKTSAQETVFEGAPRLRAAATALRERTLLGRDKGAVARIDVSRAKGGSRAYVRLRDGRWTTPAAKADEGALAMLAQDLATLRAERLIIASSELSGTGLVSPWLTATIAWSDDREPPAVVSLGKITPEGDGFHAKLTRGEDTVIFVAPKALVDALDKEHLAAPDAPGAPTGTAAPTGGGAPAPPAPGAPAPAAPAPAAPTPAASPEGGK